MESKVIEILCDKFKASKKQVEEGLLKATELKV